jgi:hypothetical protein
MGTGPKFTMGQKPPEKREKDMTSLYYFKSEQTTPAFTMSGKDGSFITTKVLKPKKSREPGPGAYSDKSDQFKMPSTKFTKAGRAALEKTD